MFKKLKNIIFKVDKMLYKKFGSDKSTKSLENIREAQKIFSQLNKFGEENKVKFVGGCVRKAILGEDIDDIDLATSLKPNEVKQKLIKGNIKVIDTGISHGTLTAIINKRKFEITTLRKDISTDGRHAEIEFTSDWEEDAKRRDFTINAIYSDIEGRVYDPLNGLLDLERGEIKFIGSAEKRIQEDYLRIIRYFRFFSQYSNFNHDNKIVSSIKKHINGLNQISNERIFDELNKILSLKNFSNLFNNKTSREVILNIFPQFKYYERLKIFECLKEDLKSLYDTDLILALLILEKSNDYEYFCHKYKTSNSIKNRFRNISLNIENFSDKKFYSEKNIKKLIYILNKNYVKDLLLFSIFINTKDKVSLIQDLLRYVENCELPKFPISGNYLKKYGYQSGEILGNKLKLLEEKWINNNFVLDKVILEKSLSKVKKN